MIQSKRKSPVFRLSPLAAAVAAVLAAPGAYAIGPMSTSQVPGNGHVTASSGLSVSGATSSNVGGSVPSGNPSLGAFSTPTVQKGLTVNITGNPSATGSHNVLIEWGGNSATATINPTGGNGFDVGANAIASFINSAKTAGGAGVAVNVLNLDTSGNPSVINGMVDYQRGGGTGNPGSLWIANQNGIMVGGNAVISAPGGLGLISGINTAAPGYQGLSISQSTLPIAFGGGNNNATLSIATGATLSVDNTFVFLAGAGNVNVNALPGGTGSVVIDGGIGGQFYLDTNHFDPIDNPSTPGHEGDHTASVNLNVGTTSNFFNASNMTVYDYAGGVTNQGALNNVSNGTFQWIDGTFVNQGTLDMAAPNTSAGPSLDVIGFGTPPAGSGISAAGPYITPALYGNTIVPQHAGSFDNAGTVDAVAGPANGLFFEVANFTNEPNATLRLNNGGMLGVWAYGNTDGPTSNITLDGSVPGRLSEVVLGAGNGGSVAVNTPLRIDQPNATVGATFGVTTPNMTVFGGSFSLNSDVQIGSAGTSGTFNFDPTATHSQVVIGPNGLLNLLGQSGVAYMGVGGLTGAQSTFAVDGGVTAHTVEFGGASNPTGDVTGTGSITASTLTFNNLKGSVNNIQTPDINQNGFQVNGWPSDNGNITISVTATGSGNQGFNLKVNGNPTLNSGNTQVITSTAGSTVGSTPDIFFVKATGNVTVDPATFAQSNYAAAINNGYLSWPAVVTQNVNSNAGPGTADLFQWPGLIYIQSGAAGSGNQITVNGIIANAFSANAMTGRAGVFLLADTLQFTGYPNANSKGEGYILTNGNAGVVMAQPYNGFNFGFANIVNGNGKTQLPEVYFWNAGTTPPSLVLRDTYNAANNPANEQTQELQTFLTLYPTQPSTQGPT